MITQFKKWLIKKYITDQEILYVLKQSFGSYFFMFFKNILFVLFVYLLYKILWDYVNQEISIFFAVIVLGIYGKFIYDFMDVYMDTVVLTNKGIHIISITWLMKFKVDLFDWRSLESITYTKNGFRDMLFNQWDILLTLNQWTDFTIENIAQPKRQIGILNKTKYEEMMRIQDLDLVEISPTNEDKFNILVETLGDVIWDYMKSWKSL